MSELSSEVVEVAAHPSTHAPAPAQAAGPAVPAGVARRDVLVEQDLLVEDVSIDGMCGVY
ncbi:MAG TPA: mycofactocin precursor MftA [Solirubrobacteraceae bacterium]|nr:mycofactocin precursor MftA [Solirubrobacteraceae bacterium]